MAQLRNRPRAATPCWTRCAARTGNVYGVPLAGNTWFMYYRKSKFTEEDITSLDAMLAKGKVSFPLTNSWYVPAFYMGAGGELFGPDGTDGAAGVQFGGRDRRGRDRVSGQLPQQPELRAGPERFRSGGLEGRLGDVVFTGNWDAATVRANLATTGALAQLPCFTLNGQQVQMKAFAGSTVYAWNPYSKHPKAADQFAAFLSGTYSQEKHYTMRSVIPLGRQGCRDPRGRGRCRGSGADRYDRQHVGGPAVHLGDEQLLGPL